MKLIAFVLILFGGLLAWGSISSLDEAGVGTMVIALLTCFGGAILYITGVENEKQGR